MGMNSATGSEDADAEPGQQDKEYTESMLAQQLAAWRSIAVLHQSADAGKTVVRLAVAAAESAGALYRDHPDVIKTKADIAEVKKKLAEINKASADADRRRATGKVRRWSRPRFASCGCRFIN